MCWYNIEPDEDDIIQKFSRGLKKKKKKKKEDEFALAFRYPSTKDVLLACN